MSESSDAVLDDAHDAVLLPHEETAVGRERETDQRVRGHRGDDLGREPRIVERVSAGRLRVGEDNAHRRTQRSKAPRDGSTRLAHSPTRIVLHSPGRVNRA